MLAQTAREWTGRRMRSDEKVSRTGQASSNRFCRNRSIPRVSADSIETRIRGLQFSKWSFGKTSGLWLTRFAISAFANELFTLRIP